MTPTPALLEKAKAEKAYAEAWIRDDPETAGQEVYGRIELADFVLGAESGWQPIERPDSLPSRPHFDDASLENVRRAIENVKADRYYPNDAHILADFAAAILKSNAGATKEAPT